jgi:hypothetical protein
MNLNWIPLIAVAGVGVLVVVGSAVAVLVCFLTTDNPHRQQDPQA